MENYKHSYKVTEKDLLSLSVYNVGQEKCDADYQWGPGIRDHYLVHYVLSGKGNLIINGKNISLSKGDCFLICPDELAQYKADSEEPWEYAWVGFSGSDAELIKKTTDFSKERPYLKNISYGSELEKKLISIYEVRGNDFFNQVQMTGRLYELFALFIENASKKKKGNPNEEYVQKSIEFIATNYSYPIKVEDIAAYVGLSRSQLYRAFMAVLDKSPKDYLTDYRIRQAKIMLRECCYPIQTIANSVGFEDSLYFSKAFKTKCGIAPSEYRI